MESKDISMIAYPAQDRPGGWSYGSSFGSSAERRSVQWSGFELRGWQRSYWPLNNGGPRRGITPQKSGELSNSNGALPAVRAALASAGVGRTAGTQAQPEVRKQVHGRTNAMVATVQIAQPVETFDDQGQ